MTQPSPALILHRVVFAVTGPDARDFLQRVVTNGPDGVAPDAPAFSALLTPQGKVLADFMLFDDGAGGLFLDAPESAADDLLKRLKMYRLRAEAEITRRDDLAVATGTAAPDAALACAPDPRNAALGLRMILPADAAGPADPDYDARRIQAIVPEFDMDYGPAEVFSTDVNHDLMAGVDYKKGCFVGQEVASRMHRKGGVRKRTIRLDFEGPAPERGADVSSGDVAVGTVTSSADGSALALVRIDRLGDARTVTAQDLTAQIVLPGPQG